MAIEFLSRTFCEKVKAKGMYADGKGLYLQVGEGGRAKSWIFRYAVAGRDRNMGLGSFDTYTLDEARAKAVECRKLRDEGIDPITHRQQQKHERTLAARLKAKANITLRECA